MTTDDAAAARDMARRAAALDDTLALAVASDTEAAESLAFGLDESTLRRVVACALAAAGITVPVEVSLLLTSDDTLHALNRDYRGLDTATDVLSFPLLDHPLASAPADQLWQPADESGPVIPDARRASGVTPGSTDTDDTGNGGTTATDAAGDTDDDSADAGAGNAGARFAFLGPRGELLGLGDIAISGDAVRRQAAGAGHRVAYELAYLLAHGVLHLVGFDDHTEAGYQAMVALQQSALVCAGIGT
ncbi:MAG: rRNA maturation RNase YbeY [Ktedonobacterales bacterium]